MNLKLLFFQIYLWYCHMRSEIIQIEAKSNYDSFQQRYHVAHLVTLLEHFSKGTLSIALK
jgi:hypothetical protein